MSAIPSWLASPPPDAAVALAPESVSVAVLGGIGRDTRVHGYAIEPLHAGALSVSMTSPNVHDRTAVSNTLQAALERLGGRPRRVALVVPDAVARVSLVRFDQIPSRTEDLAQLIRWQVKKAAPFPVDDALLTFTPAAPTGDGGREFVAVLARREIVREYEQICEAAGMHAGLVDLATFGLVNLVSASQSVPRGDWLLIHVRPDSSSLAILRNDEPIYFRQLSEADGDVLADVTHQTAMYYQDRLGGRGFTQVMLAGIGPAAGALDAVRDGLEDRLAVPVKSLDETASSALIDSIAESPELLATLAPLAGTLARARLQPVGA